MAWATISVPDSGTSVMADGTGSFRLRGLGSGEMLLVVERLGYATARFRVQIASGSPTRTTLTLDPLAVDIAGVTAVGLPAAAGATHLDRVQIEKSGARTLGDVARELRGVTLLDLGPGAGQTISVRGSSADAVLVLVDGAPLNDPLTGEADLSTVSAEALQDVLLITGGASARYGPRAEAGVLIVRSRGVAGGIGLSAEAGSLGRRELSARASGTRGGLGWTLGAGATTVEGAFDFQRPTEVGGGDDRRGNADLDRRRVALGLQWQAGGGEAHTTLGYERLERGLPGKSFVPSPGARQSLDRTRWSGAWSRATGSQRTELSLFGTRRTQRFRDGAPPLGLPFDQRTQASEVGGRVERVREFSTSVVRSLVVGGEVRGQRVRSDALSVETPAGRSDVYGFAAVQTGVPGSPWSLALTGGLYRDPTARVLRGSHDITVRLETGRGSLSLAHRSAFSPPTLSDQFFQEGVGIEPNPDLRGERVPGEIALDATAHGMLGTSDFSIGIGVFRADVRDMIVWQPDFRFVWSPQNADVKRRGGELWGRWLLPAQGLEFSAGWLLARTTYDRADSDTVQVAYRPRHSGNVGLAWDADFARVRIAGRYTGLRYPVPAPVNALPGFWAWSLDFERSWTSGRWETGAVLKVDRLLDAHESLIFGYPHPGRTLSLRMSVARAPGIR